MQARNGRLVFFMGKTVSFKESFTNFCNYFGNDPLEVARPAPGVKRKNFITYLTLFQSDLYRINDLDCYNDQGHVFTPNYTTQFSINFTRKGYFTFKTYRRLGEEYASCIMLEKPGCEFRFVQEAPGEGGCTVFSFTNECYDLIRELFSLKETEFFRNENAFSTIVVADAAADFLHYKIFTRLQHGQPEHLEMDCLVAEFVEAVINLSHGQDSQPVIPASLRRYHFPTIERAKEYLVTNFTKDVTLKELAKACFVSQFYFTRIFKQFCGCSPFHYLQQIRLKYAETLLLETKQPVADIGFQSGFRRLDTFSSAFAKTYGASPSQYRLKARKPAAALVSFQQR